MMRDIERVEVDTEAVRNFDTEDEHVELSFNLLRETTQYVLLFASLRPRDKGAWSRDQAVLCGHMVRLGKLMGGMMFEVAERRQELAGLFIRLIMECIVNLLYLIQEDSADVYESYIRYSLRHEKALLERIDSNIAERDNAEWDIENRMRASIQASFEAVDVDPADVNSRDRSNWGGDSIYGRCKKVGLQPIYLSLFSGASHFIHGNWQDLYDQHLTVRDDGLFLPNTDWEQPRPQPINVTSCFAVDAIKAYVGHLDPVILDDVEGVLTDLFNRVQAADLLHEEYLIKRRAA